MPQNELKYLKFTKYSMVFVRTDTATAVTFQQTHRNPSKETGRNNFNLSLWCSIAVLFKNKTASTIMINNNSFVFKMCTNPMNK